MSPSSESSNDTLLIPTTECSSVMMKTMSDVVNASEEMKLCKACEKCAVINKVHQLRAMLQPHHLESTSDVYDFDAQTDDWLITPPFYQHRRRRRSDNVEKDIYLDLFDEHVVAVRLNNNDVSNARYLMRSQAHKEFVLEGNEDLLNKLLEALKPRLNRKSKSANKKRKQNVKRKRSVVSFKPSTSNREQNSIKAPEKNEQKRLKYMNPIADLQKMSVDTMLEESNNIPTVEAPTFHLTKEEFNVSFKLITIEHKHDNLFSFWINYDYIIHN